MRNRDAKIPLQPVIRLSEAAADLSGTGTSVSLAWDGEAFAVVWREPRHGFKFLRGRFDCF